jgi:hypothetical protein
MLPFLVAVFIVAIAGTFLALQIFGGGGSAEPERILVTVPIVITATPDPLYTPPVIILTATVDRTQVALPPDILESASAANAGGTTAPNTTPGTPLPTLNLADAQQLNPGVAETATALPQNCILHTLVEGDTPFGIAAEYGANPFLLLEANGLTEETSLLLQIGQTLIVPLEGCPVEDLPTFVAVAVEADGTTAEETAEATQDAEGTAEVTETLQFTLTPSPSPTITLAPTAANAQIEIVGVERPGDVTAEGIRIRNNGNTVRVTGWRLTDLQGNEFVFPEVLIFSNQEIAIFTRPGQNTPIALFWGLDTAVWGEAGDVITLYNDKDQVQATLRLTSTVDLE